MIVNHGRMPKTHAVDMRADASVVTVGAPVKNGNSIRSCREGVDDNEQSRVFPT